MNARDLNQDGPTDGGPPAHAPARAGAPGSRVTMLPNTGAPAPVALRTVRCYHCERDFDTPVTMRSTMCPRCARHVNLDDLVATRKQHVGGTLATCGRLVVEAKSSLTVRSVSAVEGVEIRGHIEGAVRTPGGAIIGHGARVKGNLSASSIVVEAGAVIEGGFFEIGPKAPQNSIRPPRG